MPGEKGTDGKSSNFIRQRSLDGEVSSYIMLHPVSPWFIVTMLSVNGCGFQKPKPLNLPPKPLVTTPHSRSFRLGSERERCNILEGDRGSIDFGSGEKKLAFFLEQRGKVFVGLFLGDQPTKFLNRHGATNTHRQCWKWVTIQSCFLDVRVTMHWLRKCLLMHTRNGKGAYAGVFLD